MTQASRITHPLAGSTLAVLLAVAGLATLNWHAMNAEVDVSPLKVAASRSDDRVPSPSNSVRASKPEAQADLSDTLKRPLFTPTRRPFDPVKNMARAESEGLPPVNTPDISPQAPPTVMNVMLVGYTSSPQRGKRALVRTANERVGTWIAIGDQVDGWRLRELSADRATFESGSQRQVLVLEAKPQPGERTNQAK